MKGTLDPFLPWLLAGWVAGVLLLSTRFFASWLGVQRLRRRGATPVPSEWHLVLSRLCRELKLSRPVRLLQSAAVEVPTALGCLRPVILLPACALTGLAPVQLEAILAHELAHVRRGDFLVNLLQSLVEVLLFYHPAVWWLSSRIRAERELCCDDVAAALCGDPLILARALTDLEALREPVAQSPSHLALGANGGSLMHRVRHLLHPSLPVTSGARAAALALLAASLLGAAGVALQDKEPASKGDKSTRMKVIDGDRQMDVRLKGEVQLDPAAQKPVTVPGDGSFRVEEKKGGKVRVEVMEKDGEGPGTVIIRKDGDPKNVTVKRYKIKKDGAPSQDQEWTFTGPEGEDVLIEGMDKVIRIPPIHTPKMRLRHLPPLGPEVDPQREMAEIQAELKALQARLEQLQKQVATPREPPKTPKPPKAPKNPPDPEPFPVPLPPAPEAPPAPPAPPVPPPPPPSPPPLTPTPPAKPGA